MRARGRGIRWLALATAVSVGTFLFLHSAAFRVQTVTVEGTSRLGTAEVRALLGLDPGAYLWRADPEALAERLRQHPLIAQARVTRVWPRGLRVQVRERVASAIVGYYRYYLALDTQGVALEMVDSLNALDLPLITGADAPWAVLGEVYPSAAVNPPLQIIASLAPERRRQVEELHVDGAGDITLYLAGGRRVLWGQAERLQEKTAALQTILLDAEKKKLNLLYIDLRYRGQPVVKLKE